MESNKRRNMFWNAKYFRYIGIYRYIILYLYIYIYSYLYNMYDYILYTLQSLCTYYFWFM